MKFLLALAVVVLAACSSTTTIRTSDPEARIYVNGEYIGTGQAAYSDRKVSFSRNIVTLSKPGCPEQQHEFRRNEDPDGGAIIGGLLVGVPFLWVTEYKDQRAYEYDCSPLPDPASG
ncbi:MAG: hypothetical protein HKO64_11905 [Xanthomonadales bacterium]|nr:hypothetical protein [Xanthomonadales bacterium]